MSRLIQKITIVAKIVPKGQFETNKYSNGSTVSFDLVLSVKEGWLFFTISRARLMASGGALDARVPMATKIW